MRIDILMPQTHREAQVLAGVFGTYLPGGRFEVDEKIRDMAPLFQLIGRPGSPLPITPNEIVAVEIDDHIAEAFQLNLIANVASQWPSLYAQVGGAVGSSPIARAAIEAERLTMERNVANLHEGSGLQKFIVPVSLSGSFDNTVEYSDEAGLEDEANVDDCLKRIAEEGEIFVESLRASGPATLANGAGSDELDVNAAVNAAEGLVVEDDPIPVSDMPAAVRIGAPAAFDPREALRRRKAGMPAVRAQVEEDVPVLPGYASFPGDLLFTGTGTVTVYARNAEEAASLISVLAAFPSQDLRDKMLGEISGVKVEQVDLSDVEEARDAQSFGVPRDR